MPIAFPIWGQHVCKNQRHFRISPNNEIRYEFARHSRTNRNRECLVLPFEPDGRIILETRNCSVGIALAGVPTPRAMVTPLLGQIRIHKSRAMI